MANRNDRPYSIEEESYLWEVKIEGWNGFCQLFNEAFDLCEETSSKPLLRNYVWRGHRLQKWKLESSFDREFNKRKKRKKRDDIVDRHLNSFAYACRGKLKGFGLSIRELRSLLGKPEKTFKKYLEENFFQSKDDNSYKIVEVLGNWINKGILNRNHIWALGQHQGLATPLLDWCYSPFVAALFAFEKKNEEGKEEKRNNDHRVIFGIPAKELHDVFHCIVEKDEDPELAYFDPMSSEHPRLVNQSGLFTITRNGRTIESILEEHGDICHMAKYGAERSNPWLIKIQIEDTADNREHFLHGLNAMDINPMSLYPEIQGAAQFCNLGIELDDYARFRGQGPS